LLNQQQSDGSTFSLLIRY